MPQTLQPDPLVELSARLAQRVDAIGDPAQRSDLLCRLGLLCWDVLGDLEAAAKYLTDAGSGHPDAVELRLHLSVQTRNRAALLDLQREVSSKPSGALRSSRFFRTCADAWIFYFRDMEQAIRAAREGLRRDPKDDTLRGHLTLALELAGDHDALAKHLRTASRGDRPSQERLVAVLADSVGQPEEAAKLLRRLRRATPEDPYLLEWLFDLGAGERAKLLERESLEALLEAREGLLTSEPLWREREATRYRLARRLVDKDPQSADGLARLAGLVDASEGWGVVLVLQEQRLAALRRGDGAGCNEAYAALADRCPESSLREAYRRRVAETFEASGRTVEALTSHLELLHEHPGFASALLAAERLLLSAERWNDLIELYENASRHDTANQEVLLERAARVAEAALGDAEEAYRLRRPSIEAGLNIELLGDQSRVLRAARDRKALRRLYGRAAGWLREHEELRRASLYASGAGVLALALGDDAAAETHLREAIELAPEDVFAHTALVGLFRRAGKWRELVGAMERELTFDLSDAERARLHAEIGRIGVEHLKDLALSQEHLEKATEIRPEDPSLFHLLARVHDLRRDYPKAVELRKRAVEGFGSSYRAAVLLCEIGEIYARHLRDDEAAEAAYREALERDDEMDAALEALAALYRRKGRYGEVVEVLQRRIDLVEDAPEQAVELHLSVAGLAERNLRDGDLALAQYRRVLELDPASEVGLNGVERICRRGKRWEDLAEIVATMEDLPAARTLLREALTVLERWRDLKGLLEVEVRSATSAEERGALARRLGELLQTRLDDSKGALRWLREAVEATPGDQATLETYAALAEQTGDRDALIEASERLLRVLPDGDVHRVEVATRLGALLLESKTREEDAVRILEAARSLAPEDDSLLELLATGYSALGRGQDRLQVLYQRADAAPEMDTRVAMLLEAADLHASQGEAEVAAKALLRAFRMAPSNRETFTRAEQLCYKLKRWKEVMEVYEIALDLVENGESRAYRLADLYARRGQLQLQYLAQPGEAAASYLKVLELDPENDTALKFLEAIFSKEGDWTGLIRAYERRAELLEDKSKRVETLRRAARVAAAKLKDAEAAARHYESIFALSPRDGEALDALERYYEHARNWQQLVAILEARLEQAEGDAEVIPLRMRLGALHEEGLRDVDAAVESYQRVTEMAPDHREALDALGRIYETTERWAEFIDVTRRQIRITQDRAAKALLYFKCGSVVESKFAKTEDAIRYYEAAIKTSASCLPAVHGLRDIYLRQEQWPKVLSTLELEVKLWQESKERAGVFARMGRIYQTHMGDLDKAVHHFKSALQVDSECMPAIRSLFDVAFAKEDFEEAARLSRNLSQKALREGEPAERSDLFYRRGMVAELTRAAPEAAENFVTALELRPENLPALDALIRICRSSPAVFDFASAFHALEKVYQRRSWPEAQARVLVAQGAMREQSLDVDGALSLYEQAVKKAPGEFQVARAMVNLSVQLRRTEEGIDHLESFISRAEEGSSAWEEALLYRAELESRVLMDSRRAAATLRVLLKVLPRHRLALYRQAQELVVQERWSDARSVCDRLIEVAADPKRTAPPVELGRYYYYLGFICRNGGDDRAASSAFRRALDLSPGQSRAAVALARHHASRGNLPQAEALVTEAIQIALGQGRTEDVLQLRRALADLHGQNGNRSAAIAELQAVVGSGDGTTEDLLALALFFADDPGALSRAIELLRQALDGQPDHVGSLRAMAGVWPDSDPAGKVRPLRALRILGKATRKELALLGSLEKQSTLARAPLTDELRARHLADEEVRGPFGQMWLAIHTQLERIYPIRSEPTGLRAWDPERDGLDLAEMAARLSMDPASFQVFVAEKSRIPAFVAQGDVPVLVLWRPLLRGSEAERRYLVARCLEGLRSGFSLLYRLGPRERAELGMLLQTLVRPKDQRDPSAEEFLTLLTRKQLKVVERVAKAAGDVIPDLDPLSWMRSVVSHTARVGMLLCDDLLAAARMEALLGGVDQAVQPDGRVAVRAIPGGQNLLRFYLSSHYDALCQAMLAPGTSESEAV